MSPPSSLPPAGVPESGANAKYAVVAAVLVLAIVALFVWRSRSSRSSALAPIPAPVAQSPEPPSNPKIEDVPPPPPIEQKPEAGTGPRIIYVQAGGCDGKCFGTAPPELNQALQVRGMQARRCYNDALSRDPSLRGHVEIAVRIGTAGNVCAVNVTSNDMHTPTVANCAAHILMNGGYPAPRGGCVERIVPMSFIPQGQ
jgi:hypothetical protein